MHCQNKKTIGAPLTVLLVLFFLAACQAPRANLRPTLNQQEFDRRAENFLPAAPAWEPAAAKQHYSTRQSAQISDQRAPEISGIAASNRAEGVIWAINDSGNKPELLAFSKSGKLQASWPTNLVNRDWEDLASFTHEGRPYLLVAETGDNRKVYPNYALHIFSEPEAGSSAASDASPLAPVSTLRFIYPDGPHNSEAVAVSQIDGKIIIVTKDADSAGIYELPLSLVPTEALVTAKKLGIFPALPQSPGDGLIARLTGIAFAVPTALDINPQSNTAVLLSYREVYRWTRQSAGQSWGEVLTQKPHKLLRHDLRQAEALSFDKTGKTILVVSERLPTPVLVLEPAKSPPPELNPL